MKKFEAASIRSVKVQDPFFAPRIRTNHEATIPASLKKCEDTGRLAAFDLKWKEGMPDMPHVFWDSDVAKVVEGMAYAVILRPDRKLEKKLNALADRIVSAQQKDGYLNTHFSVVDQDKRWHMLHSEHELYCAGHLIEAAVAHHQATGRTNFLDAMCRYADYIGSVFGRGKGKKRGYPGHEELELALCKLAGETGREKYLKLAKYFVDERGQSPNYFVEKENFPAGALSSLQAHKPVREQTEAVGHAVRAGYLYAGMADVAAATNDAELLAACDTLFENIRTRRMYITGGIGSHRDGERFDRDWNLPNETCYAESCAAISLVLFTQRMLNITGDGKYADVMERAMYNGIPSGISLDGIHYFYQNPLEMNINTPYRRVRQEWFSCSCCPTNFCRFLPQTGTFFWSESADTVRLNIPAASFYESGKRKIRVEGAYPYDGVISITFEADGVYDFQVRIPDWCRKYTVKKNGKACRTAPSQGYISIGKSWKKGDRITLTLDMPVRVVRANEHVNMDAGRAALMRGPVVYAAESTDNGALLNSLIISDDPKRYNVVKVSGLGDGAVAVRGPAVREIRRKDADALYTEEKPALRKCTVTAVPYALWQNRGESDMLVWLRCGM